MATARRKAPEVTETAEAAEPAKGKITRAEFNAQTASIAQIARDVALLVAGGSTAGGGRQPLSDESREASYIERNSPVEDEALRFEMLQDPKKSDCVQLFFWDIEFEKQVAFVDGKVTQKNFLGYVPWDFYQLLISKSVKATYYKPTGSWRVRKDCLADLGEEYQTYFTEMFPGQG